MTDADFARKQELLRQAMRVDMPNRAPMCCDGEVETVHEIKPTPVWRIVGAFLLAAALAVIAISVARASEAPRPWIVWDETADKPWTSAKGHQATATGPTACNLSLHEAAKASPDGSRLSCRRIDEARR